MRLVITCDPGGQRFLDEQVEALENLPHDLTVQPLSSDNWPAAIPELAALISSGHADCGIIIGPTGNGEAIAINRFPNIRCAVGWNLGSARRARRDLNANVLAISRKQLSSKRATPILEMWLKRTIPHPSAEEASGVGSSRLGRIAARNGKHQVVSPFLEDLVCRCEHCGEEFAFRLDLLDDESNDLIEECPICGYENEILVENEGRDSFGCEVATD